MNMISRMVFLVTIAVSFGWTHSATAQTALFNPTTLTRLCQQGQCQNAIDAIITELRARNLSPDDFNSQLGALAATLLAGAANMPADQLQQLTQALTVLASYSTDAAQQLAIEQAALAVANGRAGIFDTASPFAVSPA